MEEKGKILFIAYHFPPDSAIGSVRPGKFVKYLSQMGWRPYVLTIDEESIEAREYARLTDIGGVPIARAVVWPTLLALALRMRSWLLCRPGNRPSPNKVQSHRSSESSPQFNNNQPLRALKRSVASLLELPDGSIGWFLPAVWRGYWLIRRERIDLIVASSPPRTVTLIGLFLSIITGAKLVADLRDPWFLLTPGSQDPEIRLYATITGWLESMIMRRAQKVIATTDNYREFLKATYSHLPPDRFRTIYNGYDEEDCKGLEGVNPGGKFTLSYLGTFYMGRSPDVFLKALKGFMNEQGVTEKEVEVNFIGNVRSIGGGSLEALVESNNLSSCVKIIDTVPYRDSLLFMRRAHVLLLYTTNQFYGIPAKTFEYLAAGRRILCFSDGGATPELIVKTGAGIVVNLNDVEGVKAAIRKCFLEFKAGRLSDVAFDTSMFERKTLTAQLSDLLSETLRDNFGKS